MATWQQIKKTVKTGAVWLKSLQHQDGSYGRWGVGSTCLAVMALRQGGISAANPAIKNAIANILNALPAENCYFRSLTILALLANGEKTPETLRRIQIDAEWLIQAQGHNPQDISVCGGWGKTGNLLYADGSNTQYALMALYSASAWGVTVPQDTVTRALSWYQRNHNVNNDGSYVYSLRESAAFAAEGICHTMTAAALTGLKIIGQLAVDPDTAAQAKKLLHRALEWLDANYTMALSPGLEDSWSYYYLYSLAGGCAVTPYIAFIGTNDWYADIADVLVKTQKPEGRWFSEKDKKSADIIHTSFALLALTMAGTIQARTNAEDITGAYAAGYNCGFRIRKARFPLIKTLETFDFKYAAQINRSLIEKLSRCDYLVNKENILLIGNPGTGKTHLATALGIKVCNQGYHVRFYTAAALAADLLKADTRQNAAKFIKYLNKIDLLIIDELSYLTLSRQGAELLFQVMAARNERASLIITTNLKLSQWEKVFQDPLLTAAIVDRMIYKSYIIDTHGTSYRQGR